MCPVLGCKLKRRRQNSIFLFWVIMSGAKKRAGAPVATGNATTQAGKQQQGKKPMRVSKNFIRNFFGLTVLCIISVTWKYLQPHSVYASKLKYIQISHMLQQCTIYLHLWVCNTCRVVCGCAFACAFVLCVV